MPTLDKAQGEGRLVRSTDMPAMVLRRHYKGFVRGVRLTDSTAHEDLIADGFVLLVKLHNRTDSDMAEETFRKRAYRRLKLYYLTRYRKWRGIYRSRHTNADKTKNMPVQLELDRVIGSVGVEDVGFLLRAQAQEFLAGLSCDQKRAHAEMVAQFVAATPGGPSALLLSSSPSPCPQHS
jgi:hypothetical protein